jgi:UDP-N-acetylglucosamine--N-acetylmuramyl-(pentapeptide) pyrophosphoryl-undecaprenol N-acetylglucosamine transferase
VSCIVVAGGGTGGHLFPGLAVAARLREAGAEILWLGARRGIEADRVPAHGFPLRLLAVRGAIARSRVAQLVAALGMLPAAAQAAALMLRARATAVLAVGGYASLPGALGAGLLGLPVVLQEQNAVPGFANRFLAPWAVSIACGFPQAVGEFPSQPARLTGNPVRPEFFAVPAPPLAPTTLLVLGGSQGSAFLNRTMPEAFGALHEPRPRIIHQSGPRWLDEVRQRYVAAGVTAQVVAFIERPADALAQTALVVARAGAMSVSELAAARRAAVLIPFAAAAHGHQLANARALAETGAAEVIEEGFATPDTLAGRLRVLLADPDSLVRRGAGGAVLAHPRAAATIARLVLDAAGCPADTHGDQSALHRPGGDH